GAQRADRAAPALGNVRSVRKPAVYVFVSERARDGGVRTLRSYLLFRSAPHPRREVTVAAAGGMRDNHRPDRNRASLRRTSLAKRRPRRVLCGRSDRGGGCRRTPSCAAPYE